jgi:hypothetical protein
VHSGTSWGTDFREVTHGKEQDQSQAISVPAAMTPAEHAELKDQDEPVAHT